MNISERKKIHIPIQKGVLKGKKVPLPPSLNGYRNFTSSLIKEALFQHIENFFGITFNGRKIYHIVFFDLCAGSGQIGLEAYSRGFNPVHIVEKDKKRFEFILEHLKEFRIRGSKIVFHQKDFRRMADDITQFYYGAIFIDLPYTFWKEDGRCGHLDHFFYKFISHLSEKIQNDKENDYKYIFIIQSPKPYQIPLSLKNNSRFNIIQDIKHYRKHYLNLLKINLTQ
jgi:16S rRNA G966 N2-methylase RsmD